MADPLLEKLSAVERRFLEIEQLLATPEVARDPKRVEVLARERKEIKDVADGTRALRRILEDLHGLEELASGSNAAEVERVYGEERERLKLQAADLRRSLEEQLFEEDPDAGRNVILEIRAGTGGEEAALFAADLFRMYSRYATRKNLAVEVMNTSPTGIGGLKEVIFSVLGRGAFAAFRYEMGTHRVQRVPATEAGGRIHTSAVTVAVLPEADEVEIKVNPQDIRVDVFRSGGPGGQSVNTTDSAVRITHLATGLVVSCQDEKSQHKNKDKAMRVLRARLLERERTLQAQERSRTRREQVGTGDRSGKIRTYNFPDQRVTDHRIKLTLHDLPRILDGQLDPIVAALRAQEREGKLREGD